MNSRLARTTISILIAFSIGTCGAPALAQSASTSFSGNLPVSEITYRGANPSRAFTAMEPYVINVMGASIVVPLYRASRTHDFSGDIPFINPTTHVADPGMFQAWDPKANASKNLLGKDMTNAGFPGRVEKVGDTTMVRYNAGDGITAGACRTQVNSYAIPPRTQVRWELELAFGADDQENTWVLTPPMQSRVLFWQVKSPAGSNPSMSAVVDTDPENPNHLLSITFFLKGGRETKFLRTGTVHGIPRNTQIPIVIEAFLDERDIADGGKGRMRVWVSGVPVSDVIAPTLSWGPGEHNWSMNMYLYDEKGPFRYTRASFWKTAKMIVYP